MKLSRELLSWDLAYAFLGLRREIPSATGGNLLRQERAFVRLRLADGAVGYGEAAPHPTRGPSLGEVVGAMRRQVRANDASELGPALQIALADARAKSAGQPLWRHLGLPAPRPVPTLETVGGTSAEFVLASCAGKTAVKLKVMPDQPWFAIVQALHRRGHLLALDPNGSWSPQEAADAIRLLGENGIVPLWLEQPCGPAALPPGLHAPFPVLADEATHEPGAGTLLAYDGLILKPAVLGLAKILALAAEMRFHGRRLTAGCHLQSSLTTAVSLQLSGLYNLPWVDLDTALLVEDDPFTGTELLPGSRLAAVGAAGIGAEPSRPLAWKAGGTVRLGG